MGSITIPTSELLGCIADVLPVTSDKSAYPGIAVAWSPGSDATPAVLRMTSFDVYAGSTVAWTPYEGDEGVHSEDDGGDADPVWGGDADPFEVFVDHADAKEILKIFRLPAKKWRTPVTIKVNAMGTKLIVERTDAHGVGERMLIVPTYNDTLRRIPDVRALAEDFEGQPPSDDNVLAVSNTRLAALGSVRPHGAMRITGRGPDEPIGITIGNRFSAFLYRSGANGFRG